MCDEDKIQTLLDTIASQRAMLNNAEAVNAELMLEVANARATAAMESDLLVQNERLGALVDQQLGPCLGCYEAPEEHCPRHGRSYTDMLESMDRMVGYERARIARAEALAEEWLTERIDVSMHGAAHELKEAIKYV